MARNNLTSPVVFLKENWIRCLCLIFFSFGLYFQALDDAYILDDKIVLSENTFVKDGLQGILRILSHDTFYGYFHEKVSVLDGGRYRPLSLVTYAIEIQFLGMNPYLSHVINILLYGIIGILIYLLFYWFRERFKLRKGNWLGLAFMGAAFFIFHPIHSEAVVNIKGRDGILSLLFSLSALIVFLDIQARHVKSATWWKYLVAGLFYSLALLSKENAITFLAVIPLTLYFFQDKTSLKKLIVPFSILLSLSIIYLLVRFLIVGVTLDAGNVDNPLNNPFYGLSDIQVWGTILYTFEKYFELFLFPVNLSHDYYPYAIPVADFGFPRVWIALIGFLGMIIYAIYGLFKKKSIATWSVIYFLLTFSIVSNVFVTVGTTMNERFVFMPSVALSLVFALGLYSLRKWRNSVGIALFILLLCFYGYSTYQRVPDWRSYLALNKSAVVNAPHSARSHLFYGTALFKAGNNAQDVDVRVNYYRSAMQQFQKAENVFRIYGTRITKKYNYRDAVKMKAGTIAELYKLNAVGLEKLLGIFRLVLRKMPNNSYIQQFMAYLNKRNGRGTLMTAFYRAVTIKIMIPYAERVNPVYYDTALKYINLGLAIKPDDDILIHQAIKIYSKLGRQEMVNMYRNRL